MSSPPLAEPSQPSSLAPPRAARFGLCVVCADAVTIRGRGKLPLRCPPCALENRRKSNRESQRRFKAKARALRLLAAGAVASVARLPSPSAGPAATRGPARAVRSAPVRLRRSLQAPARSRVRQRRKSLVGTVVGSTEIRSEWAERCQAIEDVFKALDAARERARAQRARLV